MLNSLIQMGANSDTWY